MRSHGDGDCALDNTRRPSGDGGAVGRASREGDGHGMPLPQHTIHDALGDGASGDSTEDGNGPNRWS